MHDTAFDQTCSEAAMGKIAFGIDEKLPEKLQLKKT